ncbi:heavy-metal-associated domain-containing protein [Cryobacterium psychrophilum]|nr:heavy metal-associated domain-containing protein [Cryobacterium psychrophilum]
MNQNELGLTDASCACGTHAEETVSESSCGCGTPTHEKAAATSSDSADAGRITSTWAVSGMTCEHCVKSVTEELNQIEGATNVEVALVSGGLSRVTVSSVRELDRDVVAAAIDEAGYELVAQP